MSVYGITPTLPAYEEYVSPEFSWDKIEIGEDWKELYRAKNGLELEAWKPSILGQWKQYANENYDFVMIYDTAGDPTLVLQNEAQETWNYVYASDTDTPFVAKFTYDDLLSAIDGVIALEEEDNLYMSATAEPLTVYGVYAVPKAGAELPAESETEPEPKPFPVPGDVNLDGYCTITDIILLQKYLLGRETLSEEGFVYADINSDYKVNIYDFVLLKKQLLNK